MKRNILTIILASFFGFAYSQCNEIFISEYVEGSENNKAIEVYNPTQSPIDLSAYTLKRYSNGSFTPSDMLTLSGILAPGSVSVIVNGQTDSLWISTGGGYWSMPVNPTLYALGNIFDNPYPAPTYFNGDDALTIEKGTVIVDIFGKIGEDPGQAWTDDATAGYTDANGGRWWTKDKTLIRKPNVQQGVTTNPSLFNVTLQWDSLSKDTWDSLGFHTCICTPASIKEYAEPGYIYIWPNPVTNNTLSIKANAFIESVELFNSLGESVFKQKADNKSGDITFKLTDVSPGMYIIKTDLEGKSTAYRKIMIK